MKYLNICTKKTYEKDGETVTKWLTCGTLRITDDGKKFIELNHMPDTTLFVFENKPKENAGQETYENDDDKVPF